MSLQHWEHYFKLSSHAVEFGGGDLKIQLNYLETF